MLIKIPNNISNLAIQAILVDKTIFSNSIINRHSSFIYFFYSTTDNTSTSTLVRIGDILVLLSIVRIGDILVLLMAVLQPFLY